MLYNDYVATGSLVAPAIGFPSWTQVATFYLQGDGKVQLNIPKGFILKPRKIVDSWVAHAPPVVRETWDWLLMNANHSSSQYNGFSLERGEIFCSYRDIRDGLSWKIGYRTKRYSEDQMKKCMKLLRSHLMIATTKHPRGMLVSICNYNKYQSVSNYEGTSEGTSEGANDAPMTHQSGTSINKNDKKKKKVKTCKYTEDDYESAVYMFNQIREKFPDTPDDTNLEVWANEIRLMRERDHHKPEHIATMFTWAHEHKFWSANVRSPAKLRKQWAELGAQRQQERDNGPNPYI